jgi:asparagine synthase (glutamine-hydrolysing)
MCGIWAWIRSHPQPTEVPVAWKKRVSTLNARGPEGSRWLEVPSSTWCFTRLAINGLTDEGMQPFVNENMSWMCNGEIYNSKELEKTLGFVSKSGSDCEVLGALYQEMKNPVKFARALDGVFTIILFDGSFTTIARDPYGVRPLFYSFSEKGWIFASERKAIETLTNESVLEFPPGEVWQIPVDLHLGLSIKKQRYHEIPWMKQTADLPLEFLRSALVSAVDKRLMTERPVAALLSGGVDSSLIAALVQKRLKEQGKPPLKTFSIGMAGGTDLIYAKKVAEHIGSEHYEIVVTADEMFNAIPAVIYDIESYDITTVRASVGNWLIAKAIREKTDCKVVFNGDGSDEVFGSYLYFYRAPNDYEFENEVERLLKEIHMYDVLRSDRSISSHGLEARTPFLDKQFVAAALAYPTALRRPGNGRIEKQLLRDAFDGLDLLPREILYRRKEAFSDGISSQEKSWYEIIQEKLLESKMVSKIWAEISYEKNYWPEPKTPEAFYYREQFEKHYPRTGKLWPYWMPRWSPETSDPSARTLKL